MSDKVVSLAQVRILKEFEADEKVAYLEVLWGKETFAVHVAIRDLEAMRFGTEDPEQPLRDPETTYEAEQIILNIRQLANFLANKWELEHMIQPEK